MLNRKWLFCILSASVIMSASFAAEPPPKPAATPQVIRAQRFELTDGKGNVRASMGVSDDGMAVFKLLGEDGKATVQVDSKGDIVILNDGKPKVVVGATGSDYGVGVYDSKGEFRGGLTMLHDEPMLTMLDSKGSIRLDLFMGKDEPYFVMSDGKENGAYMSLAVKGSAPRILLADGTGKARTECSLADDGAPRLLMANSAGDSCLQLLVTDDLPNVQVTNPKTKFSGTLGFTKDADLALMFVNADSKLRAGMVLSKADDPFIYVLHPNGIPGATMGISGASPYFRTTDKDSGTLWERP